jgi:hypothetical protein
MSTTRRRPIVKKPWFWAFVGLLGVLVFLASRILSPFVPMSSDVLRQAHHHNPLPRARWRRGSSARSSIRVFPGLRADGADLRIRLRGTPADMPPLINVKSFHVDASLLRLWRKHVDHVQLDGLDISIPPKQVRVQQKEAGRPRTRSSRPIPRRSRRPKRSARIRSRRAASCSIASTPTMRA